MVKKVRTDLERLMSKVEVCLAYGCWVWQGRLDGDGYAAQVKVGSRTDNSRRMVIPHRLMYELCEGPIPEGLVIDHLCRNRACLNPKHLEPVTHVENTKRGARATQTHCKRGHPLFGDNVRLGSNSNGWVTRICKTCAREYQRSYQQANGGLYQKAYRVRRKESKNRNG